MSNGFPSRRSLLRNVALMTLAGPTIRALAGPTDGKPIRRVMTFFHPVGINWPDFSNRGASDTDFSLGRSLQPLNSVKDRVLVVDSPDRNPCKTENGALPRINDHYQGFGTMFTGTAITRVDEVNYGQAKGVSLDIQCANALHTPAQRALQFGINTADHYEQRLIGISHRGGGIKLNSVDSPLTIFDSVFKDLIASNDNAADAKAKAEALRRRRKSMLDASLADFGTLGRMVGTQSRRRLDADLQAFRELERSVANEMPAGSTMPIDIKRDDYMVDPANHANHLIIGKRHIDLMVAAMRADLSRFASFQHLGCQPGTRVTWMAQNWNGYNRSYHDEITHKYDGLDANKVRMGDLVKVWCEQLAYLVSKMNAAEEIDGSGQKLFDNSTIVWTTEMDDIEHQANRTPYVLVGNLGGKLKTGRHIKTNQTNADLLLSVAVAAGSMAPSDKFGFAPACSGVIPGMLT
jgi:hypothetical protein